jgi:hypothetical protein
MRRLFSALSLPFVIAACGGEQDEIGLIFPDSASRESTNAIAVTAFEPIRTPDDADAPELIRCDQVGVFPPTRTVDPDNITAEANLGRVLSEPRESQEFPFDGDWSLAIPKVNPSPDNPWGAVMIYIEARGEARAPEEQGGGSVPATLLTACYCLRTLEATHKNRQLDQQVKSACPLLSENAGKIRDLEFQPVITSAFYVEPRGVQQPTAPKNQVLAPGPVARVLARRCDEGPAGGGDCFRCMQPCKELENRGNVPVMFTVDQPGGATGPARQIALTDEKGFVRAEITVDDCSSPIKVRAQIVGRDETLDFDVGCVNPVKELECANEVRLGSGREPTAMTRLPGPPGQPDSVAILFDAGQRASLEIRNPDRPDQTIPMEWVGEAARAVHGFYYELGASPQDDSRPILAVVTSKTVMSREQVYLRLFEWTGTELRPTNPGLFDQDCATCICPTTPGQPPCDCQLMVQFQTEVTVTTADLDGDRRADLVLGTSADLPVTTYFSSGASPAVGQLYIGDNCRCAKFAQAPTTFELIDFGGMGEGPLMSMTDLVIGAPGGSFVKYATGTSTVNRLSCGQPSRFGNLVPVRDLARGRFACNPLVAETGCNAYEDVVIVAAKSLGGGSFDDPGTISVVFGTDQDLSLDENLYERPGSTLELLPLTLEGEEAPKDPRTVEVGDMNADGNDDIAVLFGSSEEIHIWLGSSNRGLGEVEKGVNLEVCEGTEPCSPLRQFALADFDGDGAREIAVICNPTAEPRLRRYVPVISDR